MAPHGSSARALLPCRHRERTQAAFCPSLLSTPKMTSHPPTMRRIVNFRIKLMGTFAARSPAELNSSCIARCSSIYSLSVFRHSIAPLCRPNAGNGKSEVNETGIGLRLLRTAILCQKFHFHDISLFPCLLSAQALLHDFYGISEHVLVPCSEPDGSLARNADK